ncbi:diguanylate cyclase [Alteromonas pelagimontana]|uniref:diguanylate cyclase n=1 Tax=Alteromonas pelagimontana TaxID=1858656 RepID=A0A6M4MAR7_9ALTE|nr:diguanylate cyclase [Alteromonas pelagimontana]QJR80281.1 diguanylate cyclase [Alteromonas pelagimontana]
MLSKNNLRFQLFFAVLFACVSILAAQTLIRQFWTLPAFEAMAAHNDLLDLKRVESQLTQEITSLKNLVYDNAVWDKIYQASAERDVNWFQETFFIPESFQHLGINGWYFYDIKGAPIAGFSTEHATAELKVPFFESSRSSELSDILISPESVRQNGLMPVSKIGFIDILDMPAVVVSHSIAPSGAKGNSHGTAVLWRYMDERFIETLTPGIPGDIQLHTGEEVRQLAPYFTMVFGEGVPNQAVPFQNRLYIGIQNTQGTPVFAVSVAIRERPFDSALFDASLISGIVISITILTLFYMFMHFQLLRPLERLLDTVCLATRSRDFSIRSGMQGRNEIFKLGRRIDDLFALIGKQRSELVARNQELQRISNTDPLTGLANRRYLDQYLQTLASHASTESRPLALLVMDIDYFKAYNDHYGHSRGDQVLKQVSSLLQQSTHSATDLVSRYGGEEFVVVLQNTAEDEAVKVAENLCVAVRAAKIHHESAIGVDILTLSVGVAGKPPGTPLQAEKLFDQADAALYAAKRAGRNRVEVAPGI